MGRFLLGLLLLFSTVASLAAETPKGEVLVLYAGSLGRLMEKGLGPAFEKSSGYSYRGESRGSVALARMIKDGLRQPDVFISADPEVNALLMGAANGDKVRWYAEVFRNEMVVGYNLHSRFADRFAKAAAGKLPIYEALQTEGLRLGRGDPKLDPKGYRTLFTFQLAEKFYRRPGLKRRILGDDLNPDQVIPEEQLEVRVETGQFDAGIFYLNEVQERGLLFVALPREINLGDPALVKQYAAASYTDASGKTLKGSPIVYTITIPQNAPHREAAAAFMEFFLSDAGRRELVKHGLMPITPVFRGKAPAELRVAR